MIYKPDLPDTNPQILDRIRELRQLQKDIEKHIKILQAAHEHTRVKTEGDQRDGYYRYCEDCEATL